MNRVTTHYHQFIDVCVCEGRGGGGGVDGACVTTSFDLEGRFEPIKLV